jgi:hypothetical protein
MARYAKQVENIVAQMSMRALLEEKEWPEPYERYAWIKDDFTMQDLARWIYSDVNQFCLFARSAKRYSDLFKDLLYVKKAQLFVVWACNELSDIGYDRDQVTLDLIHTYACKLWKETMMRGGNTTPMDQIVLPEIHSWSTIFRELGLDDLPPLKLGKPSKNRPERFIPGFFEKHQTSPESEIPPGPRLRQRKALLSLLVQRQASLSKSA